MAEAIPGQALDAAERRAHVAELRRDGNTFEQIGKQLGCSRQRAHTIYREACAAVLAPAVEAMRAEHLAELAEAREMALGVMRRDHVAHSNGRVIVIDDVPVLDDGPKLDAARTLATLHAREAKLVGADAPQRVEASLDGALRYEVVGVPVQDVV